MSVIYLYNLLRFLFKKLYKYIKLYVKGLTSYFYKHIIYRKYAYIYKYLYKNNIYKVLFKLFSLVGTLHIDIQKKNIMNIYENNSSLRSFFSTLNLYEITVNNDLVLLNNTSSLNYFLGRHLSLVDLKIDVNLDKKKYLKKSNNFQELYTEKLYTSVNLLSDIGFIEQNFFDVFDALKDSSYFDYEDEPEWGYYFDEWSGDFEIGDLSDDYIEEDLVEQLDGDEDELDTTVAEFSSELELDSSFIYWYGGSFSHIDNSFFNHDQDELWDFEKNLYTLNWSYRDLFLQNRFYAYMDLYKRTFLLYLLNLYKTVPVTSGMEASDNGIRANISFIYGTAETFLADDKNYKNTVPKPVRDSHFKKLKQLYKSKALNKKFLAIKNKNSAYDKLIPKFAYTLEPIDYLDYYLDFNAEEEYAEYNFASDIFDVVNDFSAELFNFSMKKNNFELAVLRLVNYFNFGFLYLLICNYIDQKYDKFFFFTFFYFNFNIFYKKYIRRFFFLLQNKSLNYTYYIKYIYDKLYVYLYKQLVDFNVLLVKIKQKVNYDSTIYGEYQIFLNLFIGKNHKLLSLFFFDFTFFIKKFFILKSVLGSRLTNLSYVFLVKAIDWFLTVQIKVTKKALLKFINFIIKRFQTYEYFIFFNAYKLAQIYAKYGLMETFYFFNKNMQLVSLKKSLNNLNVLYSSIETILFLLELFLFIAFFICFLLCIVHFSYDLTLIHANRVSGLDHAGKGENNPGEGVARMKLLFDHSLLSGFYQGWADIWGIF